MNSPTRQWLIAALTQQPLPPLQGLMDVVGIAHSEDVLPLVQHQLATHPGRQDVPEALLQEIQTAAKDCAFTQLLFQAEQSRLFAALNQAGIAYIVMKGSALGRWLYASPSHRPISDIDIWLRDEAAVFALEPVLAEIGYVSQPALGRLTTHEHPFDKDAHGYTIRIDAHWAMFNSVILASSPRFDEAYSRAMPLTPESSMGRMLCINDALINSIGHRALKYLSGNGYSLKWLFDLHLLFKCLDATQWQNVLADSSRYGISDLTLDALQVCSAQLSTPVASEIMDALQSQSRHEALSRHWFKSWWRYQWHEFFASGPDWPTRFTYAGQKLWPNPETMRERYGKGDSTWQFMLRRIGVGIKRLLGS